MSTQSIKHHFVPQWYLRRFAADTEARFLYVFDKFTGRSFRTSILNAGSENRFNTVKLPGGEWNFEHLFQEVDDRSALVVRRIVEDKSVAHLTVDDRVALADFVAAQVLRTRFARTTPKDVLEQLDLSAREAGLLPRDQSFADEVSEAQLRLSAAQSFLARHEHTQSLRRLVPGLYESADSDFFTSDHPVCQTNPFPYGQGGLSSPGVMVTVPLSPSLMLVLHCPTIVQRLALIEPSAVERVENLLAYREQLFAGRPILIDAEQASDYNALQVRRSARHLYARSNEFQDVERQLKARPDLRDVRSHVHLGGMGQGHSPNSRMPEGLYLAIFGPADHCLLRLLEIDEAGEGITARTDQIALLKQIASEEGKLSADLYNDRRMIRHMNHARLEIIGSPEAGWFRIVHRDEGLRALFNKLDRDR